MSKTTITHIPPEAIVRGENHRQHFDPTKLDELADSIRQHGLIEPIIVRPHGDIYQIVAGERRYRACKIAGLDHIPCIIRVLNDEQADDIMLAENTGRQDLNAIEEAEAYGRHRDRYNKTIKQIAAVGGVSTNRVRSRLNLLTLHPDVQHLVRFGNIPLGHAETMARLDHNRQLIALRVFTDGKPITLKQFRRMVGELEAEQNRETLIDLAALWVQLSQEQEQIITRGKRAKVNVPIRNDLPPVSAENTTTATIAAYIQQLESSGLSAEAATIGTLYTALVHQNFMAIVG